MKQFSKGILRSLTILVLIASVSSLGFASIQNAMAMPGVIATGLANQIPPGGSNSINYAGNVGDVPHTAGVVVVTFDADENVIADSAGVWNNGQRLLGVCQFDVTLGTNVLQVQDGGTIPSFFNIQDVSSSKELTYRRCCIYSI